MTTTTDIEQSIKQLLVETLSLDMSAEEMSSDMQLLGELPEFDSMAIVSVITSLEETYDITFDDDELSAEMFESVATMSEFVNRKVTGQ